MSETHNISRHIYFIKTNQDKTELTILIDLFWNLLYFLTF